MNTIMGKLFPFLFVAMLVGISICVVNQLINEKTLYSLIFIFIGMIFTTIYSEMHYHFKNE